VTETPGVLVADTGYWHQVQIDQIVERGIQVLIPPDAGNRKTPRPGWDGGLYAFMRRVLQTKLGGDLYRKRKGMIESVFANIRKALQLGYFVIGPWSALSLGFQGVPAGLRTW
jgi:hypothetical protein